MLESVRRKLMACGALALTLAGPLPAGEPAALPPTAPHDGRAAAPISPLAGLRSWWQASLAPLKEREAVRMVTAILEGSQMGPGDGWFGPGQSRYGWDWLAARYDSNGDRAISADEFTGSPELFERLDRDRDGQIQPADFDWSDASLFVRQQGQAAQWFVRIDQSSNGRITAEEWQQFFEKLAGDKGYLSRDDLRAGLFPVPPRSGGSPPSGAQGPSQEILLKGVLTGELGSIKEGPKIDKMAPDFELATEDGKRSLRLSSFRGEKPVVLVFGSFT